MISEQIPRQLIIDMDDMSMVLTPELEQAVPEIVQTYKCADDAYRADPRGYLSNLEASQFSFQHQGGNIKASLIPKHGTGLLVEWAAFADSEPWSNADTIFLYAHGERSVGKRRAAPNTWRQTARAAITAEVLNMSVLTIYSPIPSNSYSPKEHWQLAHGNFEAAGRIMDKSVDRAQEILHGLQSETQLTDLDVLGASLGASNAIGATSDTLKQGKRTVRSLTLQEWIVAQKGVFRMLGNFLGSDAVGEASTLESGKDYEQLGVLSQPELFKQIDRDGNEPLWLMRAMSGALRARNRGMTHPRTNASVGQLEHIVEQGVATLGVFGENSGLSRGSLDYFPSDAEHIMIRSTEGGKTAHIIDEHPLVVSVAPWLNIRRAS